ncbi:hypothetical protein TDB9533_03368 [Thalassocella blandensis]|nr:hypothetical protein TDB9533_03368 [Thalassocella blandensis]
MLSDNIILTCIDGSSVSEDVCDYASWIASKANKPLRLLHTIEHAGTPPVSDLTGTIGLGSQEELLSELTVAEQNHRQLLLQKGQLMLKAAKEHVVSAGSFGPEVVLQHGSLIESLIDMEDEIRVLVIGIRGEGHEHTEGNSTKLESVIRALHKPILVVNKHYTEPKKIMLAYDGSPACKKALDLVSTKALFKGVECHIVHVGDQGETLLEEAKAKLQSVGMETQAVQIQGKLPEVLARYQTENDIDLMAMGAFSHTRIRNFLLGSFTAKMLATTQKPLLLLR